MARCGCATNSCTCTIRARNGMAVTERTNGIEVSLGASQTRIRSVYSPSMELSLSGLGTPQSPFVLSGERIPFTGDLVVSTWIYLVQGDWTKPPVGNFAEVTMIGGGGGGGGGSVLSGGQTYGGIGGAGGAYSRATFRLADLPAVVPVAVGIRGTGTFGDDGSGSGNNGSDSVFGSFLRAEGGLGGGSVLAQIIRSGIESAYLQGHTMYLDNAQIGRGTERGQYTSLAAATQLLDARGRGAGAGGDGGGYSRVALANISAQPGGDSPVAGLIGGPAGSPPPFPAIIVAGSGQSAPDKVLVGGSGGGGGGWNSVVEPGIYVPGGYGGRGGFPGGGGGGGGGRNWSQPSGNTFSKGGDGANGIVVIRTY